MSEKTTIHSNLIRQAARNILRPLGMFQKGRSRIWLGDHGWWLDVVEFQPSSWSKGSYLNVSPMWLWNVKSYISFDEGHVSETGFHAYENEQQFTPVAQMLVKKAEERVLYYRKLFPTVLAVSDHFIQNPPLNATWRAYHAAIAHGLSGRSEAGATLLSDFIGGLDHEIEWQREADADAQYLASIIHIPEQFANEIAGRVSKTRQLQKLAAEEVAFG